MLDALIAHVREAEAGSRELDALVICALLAPKGSKVEQSQINGAWCIYEPRVYGKEPFGLWEWRGLPRDFVSMLRERGPTTDLSTAVALLERVLPGWWWRVGTCCVSDDATIGPDYNSPVHGERLRREFPLTPHEDGCGGWLVDADQRPPHSVAKALTLAILMAKKESGNA